MRTLGKWRKMRPLRAAHTSDSLKRGCGDSAATKTLRRNFRQPAGEPRLSTASPDQSNESLVCSDQKGQRLADDLARNIRPSISRSSKEGRVSFVYVARAENGTIRVGVTANPATRLEQLERASPIPVSYSFIGTTTGDAYRIEAEARRMLGRQRGNEEWFCASPESAISALMGAAAKLGHTLQIAGPEWTAVLGRSPASTSPGSATGGPKSRERRRPPLTFLGWLQVFLLSIIYSFAGFIAAFVLFAGIVRDALPGDAFFAVCVLIPFGALAIAYSGAARRRPSTQA